MVTSQIANLGRQLATGLTKDLSNLLARIKYDPFLEPGLYTYPIELSGGNKRLHLRISADGRGILFVDVTDAIHLNATAAEIAKLALDNQPQYLARARLRARYHSDGNGDIPNEVDQIYNLIKQLRSSDANCPTCGLEAVSQAPLFSLNTTAPYKADLALTYGCNNQCAHCYNEADRFQMPSLRAIDWFKVLDILHDVGVPHIIFTGGEATLHPDLLDLVHYADSLGMITGLNTNGRRLAQESFVRQLTNSGLNHIQVTLGSHHEKLHNDIMGARSFHQTVAGIQNAIASGMHCITNTTLMRCNMAQVEQTIDFLYDLGIRTFAMNGMIYSGGGLADPNAIPEEEMPSLLIRVRDKAAAMNMRFLWYTPTEYCRMSPVELDIGAKRCNAAEYSICIEPNGDVLPCQSFYTSAGNILLDDWSDIWQGDLFLSFRDRENDPQLAGLPQKCWTCPDLPLCGGGCRIEREARLRPPGEQPAESSLSCGVGCGSSVHKPAITLESGFIPTLGTTSPTVRSTGLSRTTNFLTDSQIAHGESAIRVLLTENNE